MNWPLALRKQVPVKLILLVILILAFALRLALSATHKDIFWDRGYQGPDLVAWSLVQGFGFTIQGEPYAFDAPGYPVFLSIFYFLLGRTWLAVGVSNSLLGALTCLCVYQIGKKVFGTAHGLLSALLTAFYPYGVYNASGIYDTALFTFFISLSILFFLQMKERPSIRWSLLTGLMLGLGCMLRTAMLASFLILGLWLLRITGPKRALAAMGWVTLALLITLTPWTVRNYMQKDAFIPIETKGMTNIYMGNHPLTLQYMQEGRTLDEILKQVPRGYSFSNAEQWGPWFRGQIGQFIQGEPILFLETMGAKLLAYWTPWHAFKGEGILKNVVYTASYGPLIFLAVLGALRSGKSHPEARLFILIFIGFTLGHMISWSAVRLRAPLDPLLMVLASVPLLNLSHLPVWLRRREP